MESIKELNKALGSFYTKSSAKGNKPRFFNEYVIDGMSNRNFIDICEKLRDDGYIKNDRIGVEATQNQLLLITQEGKIFHESGGYKKPKSKIDYGKWISISINILALIYIIYSSERGFTKSDTISELEHKLIQQRESHNSYVDSIRSTTLKTDSL